MSFTHQATAETLEARIRANRPLDLPVPWADELIFPHYDGLSIYNAVHTVADLLGVDLPGAVPLDETVWGGATPADIRRVVLILSDGLGYHWLRHYMAADDTLRATVADLTEGRGPVPLTSVCPSTTTTALTTLWTGASPAQHGNLSFRLFLREIGALTIPLFWQPAIGGHAKGSLSQYGLEPEDFVPVPGLAEVFAAAGVPIHVSLRYEFLWSGFSRILHRGLPTENGHFHTNSTDMFLRLRDLLAATAGQRCLVSVYWDQVDTLSHKYGSGNKYLHHEIKHQLAALRDVLADESIRDGQTLVLFLADHGHYNAERFLHLPAEERAAPIDRALQCPVSGEGRLPYLHLRADHKQAVIDCVTGEFAESLACLDPAEALAAGLFGPGEPYAETLHRLGDLILAPRLGWVLDDPAYGRANVSRHGGLSDWEMLVPLLWRRL